MVERGIETMLRGQKSTAICYRCGSKGHYGRNCEKTKNVTCYTCGGKRHLAKMCKSKTQKVRVLSQSESEYESETEQKGEVFLLSGKNTATLPLFLEGNQIPILIGG